MSERRKKGQEVRRRGVRAVNQSDSVKREGGKEERRGERNKEREIKDKGGLTESE